MPQKLKLKKIRVGKKSKGMFDMEEKAPSVFPPSFRADDKQIPEVKKFEVGKKYRLVVDIEMKSKKENEKSTDGSFDLIAYKHIPKKDIFDMDDKEFGDHQGEELSKV